MSSKRKIPKKYIPKSLSKISERKQINSILEKKNRPKLKNYKSRRSSWTVKANNFFNNDTSINNISKRLKVNREGLIQIIFKGMGAYYSSGSRPNTSAIQWGLARLYSVLFGGPARKIDKELVKKYKIPKINYKENKIIPYKD